jgi:putative ABC transport system substrate-binding protein
MRDTVASERANRTGVDGISNSCLALGAAALTRLAAVSLAFAAAILIAPPVLGAEPGPSVRLGILNSLSRPPRTSFVEELRPLGYVEGRNLTIMFLNAEDKPARLPDLAQELVRLKPDAILTMGTMEATAAAMRATATIRSFLSTRSIRFAPGSSRAWPNPAGMSLA